jgi:hypothetical protein
MSSVLICCAADAKRRASALTSEAVTANPAATFTGSRGFDHRRSARADWFEMRSHRSYQRFGRSRLTTCRSDLSLRSPRIGFTNRYKPNKPLPTELADFVRRGKIVFCSLRAEISVALGAISGWNFRNPARTSQILRANSASVVASGQSS